MAEETVTTLRMTAPMPMIDVTKACVASCISVICWAISLVALAVCSASDLTSAATTANPPSSRPGTGGFDGCVEGEQIGAAGDLADQVGDGADIAGGFRQFSDGGLRHARSRHGFEGQRPR